MEIKFDVGPRYQLLERLGSGSFGVVYSALDTTTGKNVAIKKVTRGSQPERHYRLLLLEILILKHLAGYCNILNLLDVFAPSSAAGDLDALYIVTEQFDTDLHKVVMSQELEEEHVRWILFQALQGLWCMHQAGILHRDLKPSNLLINENCEVRLCDFGLARVMSSLQEEGDNGMTDYVVTRWYRAPELLMEERNYGTAIDVWSIGCIMAEMLKRAAIFPGNDHIHQLSCIVSLVGTPTEAQVAMMGSEQARDFVRGMAPVTPSLERWKAALPKSTNPLAIDLLQKMLAFCPSERPSVEDVLNHPWFASYVLLRKKVAPPKFVLGFDLEKLTVAEAMGRIKGALTTPMQ
jgi:serine/threonine protein kinase